MIQDVNRENKKAVNSSAVGHIEDANIKIIWQTPRTKIDVNYVKVLAEGNTSILVTLCSPHKLCNILKTSANSHLQNRKPFP